ncbi:MAG: hypothetical protein LBR53_03170 [Deltaproteobacteria bacterium]|nr:hypothetical protein [Deltaproteobacteria bacterium]
MDKRDAPEAGKGSFTVASAVFRLFAVRLERTTGGAGFLTMGLSPIAFGALFFFFHHTGSRHLSWLPGEAGFTLTSAVLSSLAADIISPPSGLSAGLGFKDP